MIDIEEQRTLLELAAKAADYKFYGGGKLFWIWKDSNDERTVCLDADDMLKLEQGADE